jgi:hypothetical protein
MTPWLRLLPEVRAAQQGDEADEAFGGTNPRAASGARPEVPPNARAVRIGRGHRFAAYPRCSADLGSVSRRPNQVRHESDDPGGKIQELRGWPFAGAIILTVALGGAYLTWRYYKHHVLLPELGRDTWVFYAVAIACVLVWGIATRFGTKRRRVR